VLEAITDDIAKPVPEGYTERFADVEISARAIDRLNASLKQSPDDVKLLLKLGTLYMWRGELSNAESIFRRIIEIDSECSEAYCKLGLIHKRQSRTDEAERDFLQALEINPGDPAAHNDLGVLYYAGGRIRRARSHFLRALETDVLYKNALLNLFDVILDTDSFFEGLGWIERFLKATCEKNNPEKSITLPGTAKGSSNIELA
jgi:tetratricopeptide (TPR) repeat protein